MGLFSKGAQARIDETLDYIVLAVPANERVAVRARMNAKIQGMTGGGSIKGLSDPMSMNDAADRGTDPSRKVRRSIILMEAVAISSAGGDPAAIKGLAPGPALVRFNQDIDWLRLLADQARGNANLLRAKYQALVANPLTFLQNNLVIVQGSGTDGLMHQSMFFALYNGIPRYKIVATPPGDTPHCYTFPVLNVPAILWSNVPGRTTNPIRGSFATIDGTHLTGGTVMVTTQFSGCSFCFKSVGVNTYAAHIWPDDERVPGSGIAGGGTKLAQQLAGLDEYAGVGVPGPTVPNVTAGDFAAPAPNGGVFNVYGSGYSNIVGNATGYPPRNGNDWMTMLAFLQTGTWRFYSQHIINGQISRAVQLN